MLSLLPVLFLVLCAISGKVARGQDICQRCECLPLGNKPTQAICHGGSSTDNVFSPVTSDTSTSLELVYIYGVSMVNFSEESLITDNPVTLLIQNCTEVTLSNGGVARLRTLVVREVTRVTVGILDVEQLWALVLENIQELVINTASLLPNYSVSIGHIGLLTFQPPSEESLYHTIDGCNAQPTFTVFDSKVTLIPPGGLLVCAGLVMITNNTFEHLSTSSIVMNAEESIVIVYNHFENLTKQALNLSAPVIHINDNMFDTLPAGALKDVKTYQDTFFVSNTIQDIDIGGVLLDMSWEMVIENNLLYCDCASKRTSILNPNHDMLYLTNSSSEKLKTIFLNNYCYLNCSVSLMTFSHALILGDVCLTNDTQLEQEKLCSMNDTTEYLMTEDTAVTPAYASATVPKAHIVAILCAIVGSLLLTSSICYGCSRIRAFKFNFKPNEASSNKFALE